MTRMSKQQERRSQSPRKSRHSYAKTGSKKDNLTKGFKEHQNALEGTPHALTAFVPKIK